MSIVDSASTAPGAGQENDNHGAHSSESLGMLALRLRGDLKAEGQGRKILIVAADDDAAGLETTLELAWCLAQDLGHSVLLIDGSFGDRSLSTSLGMNDLPGLAEFLDVTADADAVLSRLEQPTAHPHVAVLPQGRQNGGQTLRSARLQALLSQAAQRHEFVLVRGSFLADVKRSMAFSAEADAALLVAVEEQTTWDQITRGQRLLNDCGAGRVALVLADRPPLRRSGRGG